MVITNDTRWLPTPYRLVTEPIDSITTTSDDEDFGGGLAEPRA